MAWWLGGYTRYFDELDVDQDGALSKAEARALLHNIGREFRRGTRGVLDAWFEQMDQDDSGAIEYDEFREWFLRNESTEMIKTCSLEKAQMVSFGENQLIDRYARSTGISAVQLNVEIERIDELLTKRNTFDMRIGLAFLTLLFGLSQFFLQDFMSSALHGGHINLLAANVTTGGLIL